MTLSFHTGNKLDRELQVLSRDGLRVLCRERRLDNDGASSTVLKVMSAAETPPAICAERLANEYALKDLLNGAWAVRPLALESDGGRTVLLLEDPGGEPLSSLLGSAMPLQSFLPLAIGIACALGKLHQQGIVHKDIKPANILVNSGSGEVRLTGFGIASRLTRERQSPEPPETIAGTLAYMAPEQTGRMNRSVDSRADLYALGITFCQMLTGALPFSASDPMEWVHCHIARRPALPAGIPAPVAAIIMKLLAKTAEDRYQTAAGVEHDLRRCPVDMQAGDPIGDFPIGERDMPDRLLIPETLYGRTREVAALLAAFDRVVQGGPPELMLVTGYSGIGKSAVVKELHKALVPPRALFASGKFDQYKRDIPYSTLAQAFQSLVRPLLSKSEAELAVWREALLEALGVNGRLMVDLVPDLQLIIGDPPAVPELPSHQAQSRFQLTFRRFISVFARPEHPLALFLDDLQWLDAATLDLIEDILIQPELRHLILIGAYRDNEVDAAHPWTRKLQLIRAAGATIEEIALAPLATEHVGQLVADSLRSGAKQTAPLAQLVHEKTGGNPFFAIQFLSELADENLLRFEHPTFHWSWDLDGIHAKGYTDNVVRLMIGKLTRLPMRTQNSLQQLACFGNIADVTMLSFAFGMSEEQVHADLWEALRVELAEKRGNSYKFVHDRVHEAAYALIPEVSRDAAHLQIGRLLLQQTSAERRDEMIFEIVNQLNRGVALIADPAEREQLAALNLAAGRRAKASTAYASACIYLRAGMALVGEHGWTRRYDLAFPLWLERADCEFLIGNFEETERLTAELVLRATSKIDKAAAYRIKVEMHVLKSEHAEAIEIAVKCLGMFGIKITPHPERAELDRAYREILRKLDGRPIETLIDLPRLVNADIQAAMNILATMYAPAIFTDETLSSLHLCHMVLLTLEHGVTGASAPGLGAFGIVLGHDYGRHDEGHRFAQQAHALVKRHGLVGSEAMTLWALEIVSLWARPVSDAIAAIRAAFRAGVEAGDRPMACYACNHLITDLLLRGDRLDDIWAESEGCLAFVQRARYRDVVDVITSQRRFIQTMRGLTAAFGSFDGEDFVESEFEQSLTADRATTMICWYWILQGQARFLAGSFVEAQDCFKRAEALLWSSPGHIQLLDYHYYAALAAAALETGRLAEGGAARRAAIAKHCDQIAQWAKSCPETFADKHALVGAELARLESRELDAERLYEQAIQSARAGGFIQNEALSYELAAKFYAGRGFQQIADLYRRNARSCYARWGAHGKVRQIDALHPHLGRTDSPLIQTGTVGAAVEHLDLATVIKVSQAVSSEMNLEKLLDTLMRTALEQAGAVRAVLLLLQGGEPRIRAEAAVAGSSVRVQPADVAADGTGLPLTVLNYTLRTKESVILDDAAGQGPYTADPYMQKNHARSVLCLPLILQGRLTGALYLENNLAARVFLPARISILKLLASQAAIALENSGLYRDLEMREARIRRLVDANIIGIFIWDVEGRILEANDAFLRLVGYDRQDLTTGRLRWTELNPPVWREYAEKLLLGELKTRGSVPPFEKEYFRKDGSRVPILLGLAAFEENAHQGVAFVLDLSERKQAEAEARESDRRYREAQIELAHANRVAVMGQLTASIAHEVQQPITAAVTNAAVGLRWLRRDPPNLDEVRQALTAIARDGERAGDIISGIRDHVRKAARSRGLVDINIAIQEVVGLTRGEAFRNKVEVLAELAEGLPPIFGDRVEIHQVLVNLILNAIEAISGAGMETREVRISTEAAAEAGGVLVRVCDTGPGLAQDATDRIFDPFYTTKPAGLGMGLSICRSIIEAHCGRLWVSASPDGGACFAFTLPAAS